MPTVIRVHSCPVDVVVARALWHRSRSDGIDRKGIHFFLSDTLALRIGVLVTGSSRERRGKQAFIVAVAAQHGKVTGALTAYLIHQAPTYSTRPELASNGA